MTKRARNQGIIVNVDWDSIQNKPADIGATEVTYENLDANGDVGMNPGQVAPGDHDHEIGDMVVLFENQIV